MNVHTPDRTKTEPRKGMPVTLLAALDRLAVTTGKSRLASEILGDDRGSPAPDWTPWWTER